MSRTPSQIGRYRLSRMVGEGGLARVYLAQHPRYGAVALKLPLPVVARNSELDQRFRAEARM
ncbi:MAG: hypothetical protein EI684_10080, partial [Candidatus Viridilinea halotolerans]